MRPALLAVLLLLTCAVRLAAQTNDDAALRAVVAGIDAGGEAPLTADAVLWIDEVAAPFVKGRQAPLAGGPLAPSNRVDERMTTRILQLRIAASGDMAFETSTYEVTWSRKDTGFPIRTSGALLRAWRKVDGRWQIAAAFQRPAQPPNLAASRDGVAGGVLGELLSAPPPPPPAGGPVRVGGAIRTPVKTKDVRPAYPAEAQSARVQGVVILETVIGPDGKVQSARVLRSIPLLDQAAIDAVRQWEFTPTVLNGVAVPVLMTVTVQFTLG
jgi:TonB family protein